MMGIVMEKAAPADAEKILNYLKQVGGETDNLSFGEEGMPFTVEAEAAYLSQIYDSRDDVMLVAKEQDRIVGIASLSRLPRRMGHRGDFSISVAQAYWGQGIGSQLLIKILDFAAVNDFTVIDLQVRSDNARAIRLYKKHGFQKIGTHPAFSKCCNEDVPFNYMWMRLK